MNLKDAFRAQNKLQSLMDEASDILQDRGNTLKVTTTHLRSKVMPEAQDTVVEESAPSEYVTRKTAIVNHSFCCGFVTQ